MGVGRSGRAKKRYRSGLGGGGIGGLGLHRILFSTKIGGNLHIKHTLLSQSNYGTEKNECTPHAQLLSRIAFQPY